MLIHNGARPRGAISFATFCIFVMLLFSLSASLSVSLDISVVVVVIFVFYVISSKKVSPIF